MYSPSPPKTLSSGNEEDASVSLSLEAGLTLNWVGYVW
jgi:hypothetical protein